MRMKGIVWIFPHIAFLLRGFLETPLSRRRHEFWAGVRLSAVYLFAAYLFAANLFVVRLSAGRWLSGWAAPGSDPASLMG